MRPIHELKTSAVPFRGVWARVKTHEVRRFDRDYRIGDLVKLREYAADSDHYTGRHVLVEITWITDPELWGLPKDIGVFSFREIEREPAGPVL